MDGLLTGLLRPLLEGERQRQAPNTDVGAEERLRPTASPAATPRSIPDQRIEPDLFPGEDVIDCRALVNLSGLDDKVDPIDFGVTEDGYSHFPEEEEAPISGGVLPSELTAQAAEIFRRHLGFEEPQRPACVSKLTSTGEAPSRPKSTMPVDASCYDRFESIAEKRRWTAFPAKAERAVRVPDE